MAGGGATHRPLIQPERFNSYVGGVLRHLEPIKLDVSGYVAAVADRIPLDLTTDWHFDVHQWRTVCHVDVDSVSVPEGPHQDGHEFGAVVVVSRPWVVGQITRSIWLGDRRPFHETTLGPSEALLLTTAECSTSPRTSGPVTRMATGISSSSTSTLGTIAGLGLTSSWPPCASHRPPRAGDVPRGLTFDLIDATTP